MFYSIIIAPIEVIIDWVFNFFTSKCASLGMIGAIFGVSLAINFLALPIYNVADALQEKERKISKKLEYRTKRIKKAFKGDEQFMMLSTYYRQNDYHPLYVLRSSVSILIEIPFFIAAYHYLSNCQSLLGASWWIFKDFGSPDKMFTIPLGTKLFYVNVLPILMTIINFVSGAVYTKEAPFREKIQLYVVAGIFLVMLYNSPSGLVLYWILNNLFSLIKNIVMKMKHPGRILYAVIVILLAAVDVYFLIRLKETKVKVIFTILIVLICLFPVVAKKIVQLLDKKLNISIDAKPGKTNFAIMFFSGFALALMCGFVLPSSAIATSPVEFSFLGKNPNPMTYVWHTFFVFFGLFVFWPTVLYKMFGDKVKNVMAWLFFAILICSLANIYIFKHDYGELNFAMEINYGNLKKNSKMFILLPAVIFLVSSVAYIALKKINKAQWISVLLVSLCIGEFGIGIVKSSSIKKVYKQYVANLEENDLLTKNINKVTSMYHLSKNKKNVIVLFLDRGINSYFPVIMEKFPDVKKQFNGFTYYPNTISFSTSTDLASPALMGGYEYTPEKINADPRLLKEKHNEATLVLPKLFLDGGWEVTVTDPPCPNYAWKSDFTAFKEYPEIKIDEVIGRYNSLFQIDIHVLGADKDKLCKDGFVKYGITQILYPPVRRYFYLKPVKKTVVDASDFYDNFSELYYLRELTDFSSQKNTYTFIDNETPHRPVYLDDSFERPVSSNDFLKKYYVGKSEDDEKHFSSNVASYKQIGKWLDYLRENDCYDNTRIIIVSDHGYKVDIKTLEKVKVGSKLRRYHPVLLVKDFNENNPLKTDNSFMTNADTGFFVRKDLELSDINPFTNKVFEQDKSNGFNIYPIVGNEYNPNKMKQKTQFTLDKTKGYHISGNDVFKEKNWMKVSDWEEKNLSKEGVNK